MCGRFTLRTPNRALKTLFPDMNFGGDEMPARYNIAPTQDILVVRDGENEQLETASLRWGLIPSWVSDLKKAKPLINARSETAHKLPSFRSAFKKRRCLVLADGYYEWVKEGNEKKPFYFHLTDHHPFAFAGLWERWQKDDADAVESCCILTTDANEKTKAIHNRMPVILPTDGFATWLNGELGEADRHALLRPFSPEPMDYYPVSKRVNSYRYSEPECVLPLGE